MPTRNPEELLDVFTLLTWAFQALQDAGQKPPPQYHAALSRMAPTLRALRHADGGLARFHGGGRGVDGRLDHALADSTVAIAPPDQDGLHMGYARISAGRTSLIVDAAAPPTGPASVNAHASTLAFELTTGRRPLVVNCGSGRSFGADWRRAGRATPSHTTLCLNGMSSSRLTAQGKTDKAAEELTNGPETVRCEFSVLDDGRRLELSHDGYRAQFGLTHARILDVSHDGRQIVGEDYVAAVTDQDKTQFQTRSANSATAITFNIRFHLHPDVDANVDLGGNAVSMVLKSGRGLGISPRWTGQIGAGTVRLSGNRQIKATCGTTGGFIQQRFGLCEPRSLVIRQNARYARCGA